MKIALIPQAAPSAPAAIKGTEVAEARLKKAAKALEAAERDMSSQLEVLKSAQASLEECEATRQTRTAELEEAKRKHQRAIDLFIGTVPRNPDPSFRTVIRGLKELCLQVACVRTGLGSSRSASAISNMQ